MDGRRASEHEACIRAETNRAVNVVPTITAEAICTKVLERAGKGSRDASWSKNFPSRNPTLVLELDRHPCALRGGCCPCVRVLHKSRVYERGSRSDGAHLTLRSEEHTSELQSRGHVVCCLLF